VKGCWEMLKGRKWMTKTSFPKLFQEKALRILDVEIWCSNEKFTKEIRAHLKNISISLLQIEN
jgi:hypothetical protein